MDWLFDHACRLEEENESLKHKIAMLMSIVESQASELKTAWKQASTWRLHANAPDPILKGLRVAVIGPSFRHDDYKKLIEYLGGRLFFAPSNEKLSQIDRAIQRSNIAIFMTGYAGHDASIKARNAAERCRVRITFITSTSVSGLEQHLKSLLDHDDVIT